MEKVKEYRKVAIETVTELEDLGIIKEDTWYLNSGYVYIEFEVSGDEIEIETLSLEIDIEHMQLKNVLGQISQSKEEYISKYLEILEEQKEYEKQREYDYWSVQGATTGYVNY